MHSNEVIKEMTLSIIKIHFGQECCQIIELLQFRGRLSLKELEKEILSKRMAVSLSYDRFDSFKGVDRGVAVTTKLAGANLKKFRDTLRKNLFILMQHNIITYYSSNERGGKGSVYYQVTVQSILARLRFPQYIHATKKLMSENEAELITLLIIHGRLQAKDFIKLSKLDPEAASKGFQTLLASNLICPVNLQDSRTAVDAVMEDVRIELEMQGPALTATDIKKVQATVKNKRKGDELDEAERDSKSRRFRNDDWNDDVLGASTVYKINILQFSILLRCRYFSIFAAERVNPAAGELVKVIVDLLYESMYLLQQETSESVKLFEIYTAYRKVDLALPLEGNFSNPLEEYLNMMTTSHAPILLKEHDKYSLRIADIMKDVKKQILIDIVKERCGVIAHRVWRLLDSKKKLDDKQISKMVLVEEKSARNALYQMLRLGLVFIQDVPKTIDHSANRTIFLWFVDVPRTITHLLQCSYKSINNLMLCRESELCKNKELLEKSRRSDILSGEASLAAQEINAIARLNEVVERIGVGIARLDEMCMILRDL